ncbi:MAG: bifunctional 2-polyprenyl-6-hydroxyphenol methylase/3-demethylubiquinol 3-O-methyltransferase UbiG, partial [Acetobacterales bacterium]
DPPSFIQSCAKLTRPGGAFALSTINRTAKSFLFAKVAAEYILRWLPRGTHRWQRFLTPGELTEHMEAAGIRVLDRSGMAYDMLRDEWLPSRSLDVNFWLFGTRR